MPVGASLSRGDPTLIELLIFLTIAAIAAVVGIRLGIVLIAPRISRALDRADHDEDPGDRPN
jgi:hypothetical protein